MREANALKGFNPQEGEDIVEEANDGHKFDFGFELAFDPLVYEHDDVHSGNHANRRRERVGPLRSESRVGPEERQQAVRWWLRRG